MKTKLATAFVALLCVAPFATSALTASEVQARVNELLSKIAELTAQIRSLQGQASVPAIVSVVPDGTKHRVCNILSRNLARGMTGDDVRELQEFLKTEGYFSAETTGFFGPLTSSALAHWQISQGVEGAGIVGPKTRERIKIWCGLGGDGVVGRQFTATPQRGAAPLTVTFNTWLSGFRAAGTSYTIDFGDGSSERADDCPAPADACTGPGTNTHTYTTDGVYTALLNKITDPCNGNPLCMAPTQTEVVGKLQVHVGTTACTKEYAPVCASKPIVCVTTPCNPIQQTYSNRCMAETEGASFLYEGQCQSTVTDPSTNPQCRSWYDGCNTCSRSTPGGPAMCTLRACIIGAQIKPYCTGYFDAVGHQAPTISGFSGPTVLQVNETGTWSVQASDPENQPLSYSISWGDEAQYAHGLTTALPAFTQTTNFTHSYSVPGTYVVSVIARDVDGKEAKVSITVKVGGAIACTLQYDPVCGRPSGCANTTTNACIIGTSCSTLCQASAPVTYGNRCSLDAAGASVIHEGECTAHDQ